MSVPPGIATSRTALYLAGEEIRLPAGNATPVCTRYYSFGDQTVASRTTAGLTWLVSDQHGTVDASVSGDAAQAVAHRGSPRSGRPEGPSRRPARWKRAWELVGPQWSGRL
jgi:hypothetical protein